MLIGVHVNSWTRYLAQCLLLHQLLLFLSNALIQLKQRPCHQPQSLYNANRITVHLLPRHIEHNRAPPYHISLVLFRQVAKDDQPINKQC